MSPRATLNPCSLYYSPRCQGFYVLCPLGLDNLEDYSLVGQPRVVDRLDRGTQAEHRVIDGLGCKVDEHVTLYHDVRLPEPPSSEPRGLPGKASRSPWKLRRSDPAGSERRRHLCP